MSWVGNLWGPLDPPLVILGAWLGCFLSVPTGNRGNPEQVAPRRAYYQRGRGVGIHEKCAPRAVTALMSEDERGGQKEVMRGATYVEQGLSLE